MGRTLLVAAALVALLGFAPGCFEELSPTQGFVEVDTGDVAGAEVFLDGVSQGVTGTVGPVEAGPHTVRVDRFGYSSTPPELDVDVRAGRTVRAPFAMTLTLPGAARVTSTDEVRGSDVTGAEIFVDTGGGFTSTGITTPGTVESLPPGTVRFRLRRDGFAEGTPWDAVIAAADTVEVRGELGPLRAVLAEMFTYVICPNCPPAAELLETLHLAAPRQFYVLEWHSVAGLPLYDARWAAREQYYAGGAGWPATVIQGGAGDSPVLLIGSQAAELAAYEARAEAAATACENDCPLALVVDGSIGVATADVTVRVKWRGGALPGDLELRVVLLENDVHAPGNQPYFGFVARQISETTAVIPAAGAVSATPISLSVNGAWVHDNLQVIAFVQSDATREILAVGALP